MMKLDLKSGTYTNNQIELLWDTDQMIVVFGMNDAGELVTPILYAIVSHYGSEASNNEIKIELAKEPAYRDVVVKTTVSNNDDYFVSVQPASYVDKFESTEE